MRYVPNALTILRMALTPVWLVLLVLALFWPSTPHFWWAFAMLAFLAATDIADGALAKRNGGAHASVWGAIWDPKADKALFWSSISIVYTWMVYSVDAASTLEGIVACFACVTATALLLYRHADLDIESTKLRSASGESAKTLGRLKFLLDLLALALALLASWSIKRQPSNVPIGYMLITMTLGLAVGLATINVNNRRAASTPL